MLIRMVASIDKWDGSKQVNRPNPSICGDALSDLRTKENRLSVWKCDSFEDVDDAVVALALSRDKVQKMSYLILREENLAKLEIEIADDKIGQAPGLEDIILSKHRDMIEMDFFHLGFLAEYMSDLAKDPQNQYTRTRKEVKDLLEKYRADKKINLDGMNQKLREDLNW